MTPRPTSKLLLVADPRTVPAASAVKPIRRYRLARLRLDGREAVGESRFEHLKRVFD
jgi:hypothetical protein